MSKPKREVVLLPPVSVVVLQRDSYFVAQCLEYDLTAQAEKLVDLRYEFERVLIGHMVIATEAGEEPFESLNPAPPEYWELFEQAKTNLECEKPPFRIPHPAHIPPEARLRLAS